MEAALYLSGEGLLERDDETRALLTLVDHAAAGRGGFRLVEGPAGIGKSALLRAAAEYALARGLRTPTAQASEFEGELAFGVARDLLGPAAAPPGFGERRTAPAGSPAPGADGGDAAADDPRTPLAALHAAVAELAAADGPLLLCVDDVQWADAASLRFLAFHARRLAQLPVALLLTLRTPLDNPPRAPLAELLATTRERSVRPRALSAAAATAFVRSRWSAQVGDALCDACHEATAGNPYLLSELVAALRQARVDPAAVTIPAALAIGSRAVAPLVMARVQRLPVNAIALARAAAVAGELGPPVALAPLAGLDADQAEAAAEALVAADVLDAEDPARFVHPLVRAAIRGSVAVSERARLARAAAAQLHAQGRVEAAAACLLAVAPAGDAEVAETLAAAARLARERGAPDVAATLLERALAEPPPTSERGALLRALGAAQRALGDPAAAATLRAALEQTPAGRQRAEVARILALALLAVLQVRAAIDVLDDAIAELGEEPADPADAAFAEELEALILHHASWDPVLRGLIEQRLVAPGAEPLRRGRAQRG